MKNIKLSNFINLLIFIYIFSLYFLSYREGLNGISNFIAFLVICMIWLYFLLNKKRFKFNKFLLFFLVFILICFISSLYAINQITAVKKCITLLLLFLLMISLVNYIDSKKKLTKLMSYFVYVGFITSIYILINSNFSKITRFGEELGNVNAIGMIIGISSVFCFYMILEEKRLIYLPLLVTEFIVILLTGSRKSLLFIIFSFIIILFSQKSKATMGKFKVLLGSAILVILSIYFICEIPIFYEIIGSRIKDLIAFIFYNGTSEGSINERAYFIENGLRWFKKHPFTGYGIDNYRFLLERLIGKNTYSHNNIIELLVGTGIFGTLFFYISIIIVFISLIKSPEKISHPFTAIIIAYIFISVGLIFYDDKHFLIVLTAGSIINRISDESQDKGITG